MARQKTLNISGGWQLKKQRLVNVLKDILSNFCQRGLTAVYSGREGFGASRLKEPVDFADLNFGPAAPHAFYAKPEGRALHEFTC